MFSFYLLKLFVRLPKNPKTLNSTKITQCHLSPCSVNVQDFPQSSLLECIEVLDGSLVDLCVIADKAVQKFVGLKRVLASSLDKCKKVVKVDVKTRCNKRKLSDNVGTQKLKDKKGMSSKKNIDKEKYSGDEYSTWKCSGYR